MGPAHTAAPTLVPPPTWPRETQDVYMALQTYRIVGASACVAAIMRALRALAMEAAARPGADVYRELSDAGALYCALKPSTAAYANAVRWLLAGLETTPRETPAVAAATVAQRVDAFAAYSRRSLDRIVADGCALLAPQTRLLVHDYSSTLLAILTEAGRQGNHLTVFVTAGQPVDQGPKVARAVAAAHHRVTYLPDTAIGRVMSEVDLVLSGVETLFWNGDLANTVGTFPIALVARELHVPFYGASERIKIHPHAVSPSVGDLTAQVLHGWPRVESDLPAGTTIRREVLDLTPAHLVSGYITEEGMLRPEQVADALERFYAEI